MVKKIFLSKIKNKKGESIAEVLVAVLISAVSLVMLASTVVASQNLVFQSDDTLNIFYEKEAEINKTISDMPYTEEDPAPSDIKVESSQVTFYTIIDDSQKILTSTALVDIWQSKQLNLFTIKPTAPVSPY